MRQLAHCFLSSFLSLTQSTSFNFVEVLMDFFWRNPTYEPLENCKVRNWQLNTVSTCYHHHHFSFNHHTFCKQCLVYNIHHHLLPLPNIQADKHKRENCQWSLIVWLASQCRLVRFWMCPSLVSAPTLGTFLYLFWKGSQPTTKTHDKWFTPMRSNWHHMLAMILD